MINIGVIALIDTKIFKAVSRHKTKRLAKLKAQRLRKKGLYVRVTKSKSHPESRMKYGSGYTVWVRRRR